MVKILEFLFPETIANIRKKAYNAGRGDMNSIIQELLRIKESTADEKETPN